MQTATPCTCFAIRRLSRQINLIYDQRLGGLGLKTSQYSLMSYIRAQPGIAMGALAARMGMDRSTLTRNLRPLVASGWVVTERAHDARSVTVQLTEAGARLLSQARPVWRAAQHELERRLGPELAPQLHALSEAASGRLGHTPAEPDRNTP